MEKMIDNLDAILNCIPPDDYTEWLMVGMALKKEGYTLDVWEDWSKRSAKYKDGDCSKRWGGFELNDSRGVGAGSLIHIAKEYGYSWRPPERDYSDGVMSWEDEINDDPVNTSESSKELKPYEQIIKYLDTLFDDNDMVSYVVKTYQDGSGRYFPTKGIQQTKRKLVDDLKRYSQSETTRNDPISYTLGDYNQEVGAWIRFNPMDGSGEVKNENVTAFRYALVECDTIPKEEQERLYRQHRLPIACMVDSGGKSVHAIVHIDADDYEEYRERVAFLYTYLKDRGVLLDRQNKNPSRLSRLPGVYRNGHLQRLIDTNIGFKNWHEWYLAVNDIQDDLPDFQCIQIEDGDYVRKELAPAIIDGVLRMGHKMLIAGPSKAGKSFILMQLAVAIAVGDKWLGHFLCRRGKVAYVNFEIDSNSCYNRFVEILKALGYKPDEVKRWLEENLMILNMRGRSEEMKKITPKLIKRLKSYAPSAIIIDPIYKIIMGDENNASDMGQFCNEFDKLCNETGASVILCHHHAKGFAGTKKSMDRASGSGVFARDPDALIDISALELTDEQKAALQDKGCFPFRMSFSLREFAFHDPVDIWFEFPLHKMDVSGELAKTYIEGSPEANLAKSKKRTSPESRRDVIVETYEMLSGFTNEPVKVVDLINASGLSRKTVYRYLEEFQSEFILSKGTVIRNED